MRRIKTVRGWRNRWRRRNRVDAIARIRHATAIPFGRDGLAGLLAVRLSDAPRCGVIVLRAVGLAETAETLGATGRAHLLADIGTTLRLLAYGSDNVVSFGDGQFGVVVPGIDDEAELSRFAERLLAEVGEPRTILERELVVHAVAGVAIADSADVEAAIDHATLACREARRFGLGHVAIYDTQLAKAAHQRMQITSAVGLAASRNELRVVFQSINDLRTGEVVGEEALARWHHPRLGLVSPDRFIPIAEESRAILSIGLWVLEHACDRLVALSQAGGRPPKMHVNVSARQLEDLTFPAAVRNVLATRQLDPSLLTLELTETGVIDDSARTKEALDALKAVGVRLAIDDFGVGYSSLSYIGRLPLDAVKIDRAFIAGLGTESADGEVVRIITDIAHRMHLDVVAEGIETEYQRNEVLRLGCVLGQGFLFGLPCEKAVEHETEPMASKDRTAVR